MTAAAGAGARRVAITGAGVVSGLGCDLDAFWNACQRQEAVVAPTPLTWRLVEHQLTSLRR